MIIKTKLTKNDILNASFVVAYRNIFVRVVTAFFVIDFLASLIVFLDVPGSGYSGILVALLLLSLIPLLIVWRVNNNHGPNARLREGFTTTIYPDKISMQGESYNTQFSLNKIHKIRLTKNWVLIWQDNKLVTPIPRRDLSAAQITEFSRILKIANVNNNL